MEPGVNFVRWIDPTDFGTVRRYLLAAKSPITGVLFVASRELLAQVAALLDGANEQSHATRRGQLQWWFQNGQLRPGADAEAERNGVGVDLERLPNDTLCEVIYLPPMYLVHVPGLRFNVPRRAAFAVNHTGIDPRPNSARS